MMRRKIGVLSASAILCWCACAHAEEFLQVGTLRVPLIAQAQATQSQEHLSGKASVATFAVAASLERVVDFYSSYFEKNGYLVIGGTQADGRFDGSIKKEATLFSMSIYTDHGITYLRFVW